MILPQKGFYERLKLIKFIKKIQEFWKFILQTAKKDPQKGQTTSESALPTTQWKMNVYVIWSRLKSAIALLLHCLPPPTRLCCCSENKDHYYNGVKQLRWRGTWQQKRPLFHVMPLRLQKCICTIDATPVIWYTYMKSRWSKKHM